MTSKDLKQCSHCKEEKPRSEFGFHKRYKDGFRSWCRKCEVKSSMNTRKRNHAKILEWERRTRIYSSIEGKRFTISNLNKRPFPENRVCEICGKKAKTLSYHHWNNDNPSIEIWVCHSCHSGCNFCDKSLLEMYLKTKSFLSLDSEPEGMRRAAKAQQKTPETASDGLNEGDTNPSWDGR